MLLIHFLKNLGKVEELLDIADGERFLTRVTFTLFFCRELKILHFPERLKTWAYPRVFFSSSSSLLLIINNAKLSLIGVEFPCQFQLACLYLIPHSSFS